MANASRASALRSSDVHSLILDSSHTDGSRSPKRAMSHSVADHIRQLIFNGTLTKNERIQQDTLAEELGVSRIPVREALITLETEGLVTSTPHRGTYVVPIKREDIEDHYRIFGMIQGLAAQRAAHRMNAPTLDRLVELNERMTATEDREEFHDLNWAFHSLINQTGGTHRLQSVLRQLGRNLPRAVYETPSGTTEEACRGHAAIVAALRDGDGDGAERASIEHTITEGDYVVARLKRDGILDT